MPRPINGGAYSCHRPASSPDASADLSDPPGFVPAGRVIHSSPSNIRRRCSDRWQSRALFSLRACRGCRRMRAVGGSRARSNNASSKSFFARCYPQLGVKNRVSMTPRSFLLPNQQIRALIRKLRFHWRFWLFSMSERQPGPYDSVARRWLALVERRREHFIDLCNSGRWRQYYTRAEMLEEMRKVLRLRDQWAINAGLPPSGEDVSLSQWALSLDKIYDESQPREPSAGVLARRAWARLDQAKLDWARLNQPRLGLTGLAGS